MTTMRYGNFALHGGGRLLAIAGAAVVQLLILMLVYQVTMDFTCIGRDDRALCDLIGDLPAYAISFFAISALFIAARREAVAPLLAPSARAPGQQWIAGAQLAGFALMLAPALVVAIVDVDLLTVALPLWAVGAPLAAGAALACIARPAAWGAFLRAEGWIVAVLVGVVIGLPALAALSNALWRWDPVTDVTFSAVASLVGLLDAPVMVIPERHYIALGDFAVRVAASCSGIQGFGLVVVFVGVFATLFRDELRFPNVWLLIPIGIAVSWVFNVLRVATLIAIGAFHSPDLAVNGFHSHAGWLFFTAIALGLTFTARGLPFFSSTAAGAGERATRGEASHRAPPLLQDWRAAQIAPFMAFMASGLLASTFAAEPALAYPLRAAAMAAVLWAFRAHYRRLNWSFDADAALFGVAIGVLWIATAPPDAADGSLAQALAALGPIAFTVWVACRVIGTVALVPLIEELFFRDYLMGRFDDGRWTTRLMLLGVSTALFALLHGRWLEAGVAGLVFGLLYLRRGRLCDAVTSHAAANAVVAAYAVATGAWGAI